jgi:hypothetical protein
MCRPGQYTPRVRSQPLIAGVVAISQGPLCTTSRSAHNITLVTITKTKVDGTYRRGTALPTIAQGRLCQAHLQLSTCILCRVVPPWWLIFCEATSSVTARCIGHCSDYLFCAYQQCLRPAETVTYVREKSLQAVQCKPRFCRLSKCFADRTEHWQHHLCNSSKCTRCSRGPLIWVSI